MDQQKKNTRLSAQSRRRIGIVLTGFAALFVAAFVITILTSQFSHTGRHSSKAVAIVQITKEGFQPATISVKPGTTIVWTNTDSALHQIVANPFPGGADLPSLKSIILNDNQSYRYVAGTSGTFGYHDQLSPTVNGTLIVEKQ